MALNETEIKTRQGLILELVLGAVLTKAGFKYDRDVQYDESCEKPDFLIPNESKPKIMVETHQTEARNSFQMKTLRAFTAVTESKAHFGNALVSVNVLFGDPDNELPASNVKAMCGIFDVNIIPRRDASKPGLIHKMEEFSLSLAKKEEQKTEKAAEAVVKKHSKGVTELANLMKAKLTGVKALAELEDLWNLERTREKLLGTPPTAGEPTYYKRCMLWSLFLNDVDFAELHAKQDPDLCSDSVKKQLLVTKLATVEEELDGDYYTLKPVFEDFLNDPECVRLRSLCKAVLDADPAMKWFFEDIRNVERRLEMAEDFVALAKKSESEFRSEFERCFVDGDWNGTHHTRCWLADLMAAAVDKPHNYFNAQMRASSRYAMTLGNPFNNLTIRSDRLGKDPVHLGLYWSIACDVYFAALKTEGIDVQLLSSELLSDKILSLRVDAAIKLRKLDPLLLVVVGVAKSLGLSVDLDPITVKGVVSDLARASGVGEFKVRQVSGGTPRRRVLLNTVAVHDNHGDDKSKEWGARRLATLYRIAKGKIRKSEYQEGVFVIDGEWKDKDVARLHRSGWNHVVRLADLEATLRYVFGIKKAAKTIAIKTVDTALPMAAESEVPPKLKRKGGNG